MAGAIQRPVTATVIVLQTFDCAECFNTIPAHLAQRWEGMTIEEAQQEWADVFRPLRSP